jgi:hypothetical protein
LWLAPVHAQPERFQLGRDCGKFQHYDKAAERKQKRRKLPYKVENGWEPELAAWFIKEHCRRKGKEMEGVSQGWMPCAMRHLTAERLHTRSTPVTYLPPADSWCSRWTSPATARRWHTAHRPPRHSPEPGFRRCSADAVGPPHVLQGGPLRDGTALGTRSPFELLLTGSRIQSRVPRRTLAPHPAQAARRKFKVSACSP